MISWSLSSHKPFGGFCIVVQQGPSPHARAGVPSTTGVVVTDTKPMLTGRHLLSSNLSVWQHKAKHLSTNQ